MAVVDDLEATAAVAVDTEAAVAVDTETQGEEAEDMDISQPCLRALELMKKLDTCNFFFSHPNVVLCGFDNFFRVLVWCWFFVLFTGFGVGSCNSLARNFLI